MALQSEGHPGSRRQRWLITAAVLVPAVTAVVVVLRTPWWQPGGDEALISLRAWGSVNSTELVGPYSRYGWSHPGPALFWVLAGPARLLGDAGRGAAVGAIMVNAAAAMTAVWLVRRRAGLLAAASAAAIIALLLATNPDGIWSVWNPYLTLLPFLAFLLACWSVADGDVVALPVAVVAAAFCIASHVGYAAVTLVVFTVAVAMAIGSWWRRGHQPPLRRTVLVLGCTAVASLLIAAPTAIDQGAGSGNLGRIMEYFSTGGRETVGLGFAAGQLARHLTLWGPWAGGRDALSAFDGSAIPAPIWWLLVPVAGVAIAAIVAGLRRDATSARLLGLVTVAVVMGAWSLTSVTPPAYPYLFSWLRVVAAFMWGAVALTLGRALGEWREHRLLDPQESRSSSTTARADRRSLVRAAPVVAIAVLPMLVAAAVIGRSTLPHESRARAAEALLPAALAAVPPGSDFTISSDDPHSRVVETVGSELVQAGRHIVLDAAHELAWGAAGRSGELGPETVQLDLVVTTADQPLALPTGWRAIGRWNAEPGDDIRAMVLLEKIRS